MSAPEPERPAPPFPPLQAALRLALELAAIIGIGRYAAARGGLPLALAAVLTAGAMWGLFNVPGDPSRGGAAPVRVPGVLRLVVEALVLGAGAYGMARAVGLPWGLGLAALVVVHYAATGPRLRWLLGR